MLQFTKNVTKLLTCSKLCANRLLLVIKDSSCIPLYKTRAKVGKSGTTMDINLKSQTPTLEVIFRPIKVMTAFGLPNLVPERCLKIGKCLMGVINLGAP